MNFTKRQKEVYDLMLKGWSNKDISEKLRISYSTVRNHKKEINRKTKTNDYNFNNSEEKLETDFGDDKGILTWTTKNKIKTVDELIQFAEIDTDIWEVDRIKTNTWPVYRKNKKVDMEWNDGKVNGTVSDEGDFHIEQMHQLSVWMKKKPSNSLHDALLELTNELKAEPPEFTKVNFFMDDTRNRSYFLEISLVDHHFGKLCINDEGIEESEILYQKAVENILNKVYFYNNIKKIVLPIGSDFFHIDNMNNTTKKGTPQDVDGLWFNIYKRGCRSIVESVELLREIAPVELIWVPGNHDYQTSFYLSEYIKAFYHADENVHVDTGILPRKYRILGTTCIGYTHGLEEKDEALSRLILSENMKNPDIAKVNNFEIHRGHFHKKKQMNYISTDTLGPVKVITLPSLSGTDYWHFMKGFMGQKRAIEAYLYDIDYGNIGYFTCNAEEIL